MPLGWDLNNNLSGEGWKVQKFQTKATICSKTLWQEPKEKELSEQSPVGLQQMCERKPRERSRKQVMQELVENFELDFEFNAKSLRSFKQENNVLWKLFLAPVQLYQNGPDELFLLLMIIISFLFVCLFFRSFRNHKVSLSFENHLVIHPEPYKA